MLREEFLMLSAIDAARKAILDEAKLKAGLIRVKVPKAVFRSDPLEAMVREWHLVSHFKLTRA